MPSLTKSVPKYRKHRASGQAVVTLSGVDHYLGPHGTKASIREYDRLVAEWLDRGRTTKPDDATATTSRLAATRAASVRSPMQAGIRVVF